MNRKNRRERFHYWYVLSLAGLLLACAGLFSVALTGSSAQVPVVTDTPAPTETLEPTATATATNTPLPTNTPTITPTPTEVTPKYPEGFIPSQIEIEPHLYVRIPSLDRDVNRDVASGLTECTYPRVAWLPSSRIMRIYHVVLCAEISPSAKAHILSYPEEFETTEDFFEFMGLDERTRSWLLGWVADHGYNALKQLEPMD